ncbi:NlpC/P60 family protein [Lactobacillus paragasseri]|uniref:C40 family peptidase n=1 Tax=Lactobacillus paragasseri TaxID=2107999 RepID=UPI0018CFCFE3|nr:C40 family peptidase [Lactobacillus paragasseri]MDK8086810.1 NlpC/P60 family protein [Lactobacillus paragasseri]MDX5118656.1 NlpC/P60 family protein [Lactobacillus paragasseri]MDX5122623.1 NlpC/P60 family protein [Lactobacillus paragasseri]UWI47777.1 C40 family peptidase [Lactobacillus paragasseri]
MTIKSKVIKLTTAASFAVAGIATLSAAKLNSLSFNNTAQASTIQAPAKQIGVVKVNSKTGESVAVWNSYEDGKQQTGKYLPHESSWKTYKKVKTVKGETWYNLGGDQWISGDDVQEEAPIALTADLSAVKAAVSQVPAANVASNATADAQTAVASVNNAQQAATTNNASVATAPVQTNTAATAQQTSVAAQAPVAQTTAQQSTYTASTNNTYVAPAKTNYYAQANTTVKTQQAATYSAPAQNTTATKPAQHQTQQASSQAAQQASTQSSSTAQTVVNAAKSQIGKPYVWGATGPNAYDCSGLVQYAYSQAGKNIGRTTYQQAGAGQHVSVSQAQAGDILMWGDYHDAIYVGNNQYVHAPQPGQNVTQAIISSYFMPDYAIRVR